MRTFMIPRPSAPLVINLIALFIVLGGQAVALQGRNTVTRDDIADGAVTTRNLARGVVTTAKFSRHSVASGKLANDAVSGHTIHPGSVQGIALRGTIQIPVGLPDADAVPENPQWTNSGRGATCPKGTVLLNGGVKIEDGPGSPHMAMVQATYPSASNASTWLGAITTNTGGASPGTLYAHCLR